MTKTKYGIIIGGIFAIMLISFIVWVNKPDYSRRGKFVFIGRVPCVVVKESNKNLENRTITLMSQNALGEFYEITVPVEMVSDTPPMPLPTLP